MTQSKWRLVSDRVNFDCIRVTNIPCSYLSHTARPTLNQRQTDKNCADRGDVGRGWFAVSFMSVVCRPLVGWVSASCRVTVGSEKLQWCDETCSKDLPRPFYQRSIGDLSGTGRELVGDSPALQGGILFKDGEMIKTSFLFDHDHYVICGVSYETSITKTLLFHFRHPPRHLRRAEINLQQDVNTLVLMIEAYVMQNQLRIQIDDEEHLSRTDWSVMSSSFAWKCPQGWKVTDVGCGKTCSFN